MAHAGLAQPPSEQASLDPAPLDRVPGDLLAAAQDAFGSDAMLVGCLVLATLALAALTGVIGERRKTRKLAREARSKHDAMRELIRTMRLAESMAGIGLWQYNPETGEQQWSDGLKILFGIERDAPLVEGDAEAMLYANGTDLVGEIEQHAHRVEPYSLRFDVYGFDGVPRSIAMQACNMRKCDGSVQRVVAVVRDITDEVLRERQAERERRGGTGDAQDPPNSDANSAFPEMDSLTGLANRRTVMRELDGFVARARQRHQSLVAVMFDIDHLKRVNDRHGREAGDLVLRKVAQIAREQAREHDLVGRIDGEEFIWIIPGASESTARVMAERMRQEIAKASAVGSVGPVTVSLGFAVMVESDTPLSLFARADRALYEAMNSGRNRVRAAA